MKGASLRALVLSFIMLAGCAAHDDETLRLDAPAATASEATFLNTRWRAVEVDGIAVSLPPDQREPYIRLMLDGDRMEGWAGCNRITGGFEDSADRFKFTGIATTLMMCEPATAAFEKRYIKALSAATSRKVVGEKLELRDGNGTVRVRFESLYLN